MEGNETNDERTDECPRCGAEVPHYTSHQIKGQDSVEGYMCERWCLPARRQEGEQPRGTVILSASEYRAEREELLRLRAVTKELEDAADDMRIARTILDLATTNGVVNWIRCALDELDELRAVVGPRFECGRYAVEHREITTPSGDEFEGWLACPAAYSHPGTPEYLAWRESRRA